MAGSGQARAVIELFCKILEENISCVIRAETLRQAKFNKQSATEPLWKLIFHVVYFCTSHLPHSKFKPLMIPALKEEEIVFVKTQLQKWGYIMRPFARLPHDFSSGSRELLLALGWVIHTQQVFDKIISSWSSPLQQDLMEFLHQKGPSLSSESQPCSHLETVVHTPKDKIQRQLLLCGKLRLSLRRLYMTHQALAGLKLTICKSTEGVSLLADDHHLSPLEVYLLRYPDSMKKMLDELEKDNARMKNLLDWTDKEHIFWEWMTSVLTLHNQEKAYAASDTLPAVEEVYLPLPGAVEKEIVAARTKLRDFILKHEADIEQMEQLLLRKKVSDVEAVALKHQVDNEISQLTQRLHDCGRGWNWGSEGDLPQGSTECLTLQDCPSETSLSLPKQSKPKYVVASAQAMKTARQARILEDVRSEISRLEDSVLQLETELKHMEKNNLRQLHALIEKDSEVICVQPRYCKQLVL
ncbi:unnamed protein product [Candidula unifasciata]|uniref:Tubulin epsilon and delta complex protein 1 domain-containing protein n=1 Tax=Candidula unifasciata TaxID=100452 RepID=A0A8S3ZDW5_9EUPU|nr:unnamed protein product [Candidula unifasciata]